MAYDPVVFISSTSDDLKDYREQASRAASASGFSPRMMEYFPASGHKPSLAVCLDMVAHAEVVVVILAHRYGWVPDDPSNIHFKSITWLECEHAWNVTGKEVIAFLVDPGYKWDAEKKENYRLITEINARGIRREVQRNEKKLAEFRRKLNGYVRGTFTDPASLRALVSEALAEWRRRNPAVAVAERHDPDTYLKALEDDTRRIRITGLTTKRAEPYFFGIDEIYIPLTTVAAIPDAAEVGANQPTGNRASSAAWLSSRRFPTGESSSSASRVPASRSSCAAWLSNFAGLTGVRFQPAQRLFSPPETSGSRS
jgi:hypothetical protein